MIKENEPIINLDAPKQKDARLLTRKRARQLRTHERNLSFLEKGEEPSEELDDAFIQLNTTWGSLEEIKQEYRQLKMEDKTYTMAQEIQSYAENLSERDFFSRYLAKAATESNMVNLKKFSMVGELPFMVSTNVNGLKYFSNDELYLMTIHYMNLSAKLGMLKNVTGVDEKGLIAGDQKLNDKGYAVFTGISTGAMIPRSFELYGPSSGDISYTRSCVCDYNTFSFVPSEKVLPQKDMLSQWAVRFGYMGFDLTGFVGTNMEVVVVKSSEVVKIISGENEYMKIDLAKARGLVTHTYVDQDQSNLDLKVLSYKTDTNFDKRKKLGDESSMIPVIRVKGKASGIMQSEFCLKDSANLVLNVHVSLSVPRILESVRQFNLQPIDVYKSFGVWNFKNITSLPIYLYLNRSERNQQQIDEEFKKVYKILLYRPELSYLSKIYNQYCNVCKKLVRLNPTSLSVTKALEAYYSISKLTAYLSFFTDNEISKSCLIDLAAMFENVGSRHLSEFLKLPFDDLKATLYAIFQTFIFDPEVETTVVLARSKSLIAFLSELAVNTIPDYIKPVSLFPGEEAVAGILLAAKKKYDAIAAIQQEKGELNEDILTTLTNLVDSQKAFLDETAADVKSSLKNLETGKIDYNRDEYIREKTRLSRELTNASVQSGYLATDLNLIKEAITNKKPTAWLLENLSPATRPLLASLVTEDYEKAVRKSVEVPAVKSKKKKEQGKKPKKPTVSKAEQAKKLIIKKAAQENISSKIKKPRTDVSSVAQTNVEEDMS